MPLPKRHILGGCILPPCTFLFRAGLCSFITLPWNPLNSWLRKAEAEAELPGKCFKLKAQDGFVAAFYLKVCTHIRTHTHTRARASRRDLRYDTSYLQPAYKLGALGNSGPAPGSCAQPPASPLDRRLPSCWNTAECKAVQDEPQ